MPARRIILGLGLLLLWSLQPLAALEITQGDLKLVLHEGIGRFSLYTRADSESGAYFPLFVDQDPRTSFMSVIVGDRLFKLGDSNKFEETLQKTASGARFCWVSSDLKISEDFIFVPRGVAIRITLSTLGDRELTVGMRLCFDTYLGEKGSSHFSTSRHAEVDRELEIKSESMVSYWKSASRSKDNSVSLYSHTAGESVTVPDRIIFANWKRISETSWNFVSSTTRNFNLMPYSINDSAVCQYYSPRRIRPGEAYNIDLLFTTGEKATTAPTSAAAKVPAAQAAPEQPGKQPAAEKGSVPALYNDLLAINTLIEEINQLMLREGVSPQELKRLREMMATLRSRAPLYSGSD
jgi:hypothetical protein